MDPVGPWSAYASYNRLAGVQAGTGTSDLHHHLPPTGTPVTTTAAAAAAAAQLLPAGFLPPSPVGYETVFSPLFHHANASKQTAAAAHYVTQQHRAQAAALAATKQSSNLVDGDYHQAQAFFEQGAWQQNSPFGILPHESVVVPNSSTTPVSAAAAAAATSVAAIKTYENFNAHFAAAQSLNHLNTQLNKTAAVVTRAQSPQVTSVNSKTTTANFFQTPSSFSTENNNKTFTTANCTNLQQQQQSCIVSSSSNTTVSKEYRIPQTSAAAVTSRGFLTSPTAQSQQQQQQQRPNLEKNYVSNKNSSNNSNNSNSNQIQTKAQTKIYPELNQNERQRNTDDTQQSSPISFSIIDAPGRLNYAGSNTSAAAVKRPQFQQQHTTNYRHYQTNSNAEQEFQTRPKSGADYSASSNGPDCGGANVVVPRRPSPLHSQASPLGHAPSPAYPMYNSPMNSISSPQSSNQVTPPSPLDVSVPRPNSQTGGNVAYSSVITRALNNNNNNNERYDRAPNNASQQQQSCWETERQNRAKFQASSYNNSNTSVTGNGLELRGEQQRLNLPGSYFDTATQHQVALQDLSSCRGDPMSLVKNLQQQQQPPQQQQQQQQPQSCQVSQLEITKVDVKTPIKRRKSSEKNDRIPPPAHSSAANHQQQQQNGAFFDFDRWNLPPPTSKFLTTQGIQQHQGLMVPHPHGHHPPPPLPYFTPFHLPPRTEFATNPVELAPLAASYENSAMQFQTQQQQQHHHQQPQQQQQSLPQQQQQQQQPAEDQPKVVVPNIEEELNFLSQTTSAVAAPSNPNAARLSNSLNKITKPPDTKPGTPATNSSGTGSDFMSSYLKFLQGERDSSPPPSSRGNRKQTTWSRTKTQLNSTDEKPPESNGVTPIPQATSVASVVPTTPQPIVHPPQPPIPPPVITRLSSHGDPQDDPRYFPLPKERKRNSFDSSDDGLSSDDDFFGGGSMISNLGGNKKMSFSSHKDVKDKNRKRKSTTGLSGGNSSGSHSERKKIKKAQQRGFKDDIVLENIPRRELSRRAAKEKSNYQQLVKNDDDIEEPVEFQDSDSDPAWTPQDKEDGDETVAVKKSRRGRSSTSKKRRNLITAAAQGAGINEVDGYGSDSNNPKKNKAGHKSKQGGPPTLEDNIAASLINNSHSLNDESSFKPGEFVVIRSDLNQEWPAIWRVDGKTLLQKYEPFEQNGITLYRNISTYTSWTPESKKQYTSIPVRYKSQSQHETIVEFLRNEMTIIDHEFQEKCMKEHETYQDNFEVYIQTLISQALDSNFLTEIFQEKDDYFLSNVKTIDDITDNKKKKLLSVLKWPPTVQAAVSTWPCFNVLHLSDNQAKNCIACNKNEATVRVLMYGQPYNSTTLEGCQPDPKAMNEKNFVMCRLCASRVELSNKVTHQKYLMYIECAKRVSEKRTNDPSKDTTCILNELLADENWLNQLFIEVRSNWVEIDGIEQSLKHKNSVYTQ